MKSGSNFWSHDLSPGVQGQRIWAEVSVFPTKTQPKNNPSVISELRVMLATPWPLYISNKHIISSGLNTNLILNVNLHR